MNTTNNQILINALIEKQNRIVKNLHVANKVLTFINKQYNYKNMEDYKEELLKQSEVQRTVVEKWLEKLEEVGKEITEAYFTQ
jgi:uncharacterized protein (UPF0332 family)